MSIVATLAMERRLDSEFEHLSNLYIPFGKYDRNVLSDCPLKYLDETIGQMPRTAFTRAVSRFVDLACRTDAFMMYYSADDMPRKSLSEIITDAKAEFPSGIE